MASELNLTTLRDLKDHLRQEVQQLRAQESASTAFTMVTSWSRSDITPYNKELDDLEGKAGRTIKDKQIMHELIQVIDFLDQLVALTGRHGVVAPDPDAPDLTAEKDLPKHVKPRLEGPKIGGPGSANYISSRKPPQSPQLQQPSETTSDPPAHSERTMSIDKSPTTPIVSSTPVLPVVAAERLTPQSPPTAPAAPTAPNVPTTPALPVAPNVPDLSTLSIAPTIAATAVPSEGTVAVSEQPSVEDENFDDEDPMGIYGFLGVPPDIPFHELTRVATRKRNELHPDRNGSTKLATARFTEFMAIVEETIINEEARRAYDGIKTVGQFKKLENRIRFLKLEPHDKQ